ncbi:putative lipid II flippase FtsW [Jatrophihabitans endophyticus]|uniref:putative lipid II flippase FtsW n=1 Tax=Jatrophihabitans endophyticus TaxID=1206085 RepID=UPI0019DFB676|nr:putative lipid II flippase FtsW [Jatrophihabitans endophyticus]MBE7188185.1 putative lipid II flippase FtsW [Jatrophihabitans endophyticus]
MTAVPARERFGGGRARAAVHQFLQQPFASVQMLLLAVVGLLGFGILMSISTTISAASDNGGTGSIWSQGIKEGLFVCVGLVIFWFAMRLSPRALRAFAYPLLALAVASLLAVLIPGIGVGVYGARRWIDLGPLQLQPSELAKVAMMLWGADLLARKQQLRTLKRARHLFVPLVPGFALVSLLVMAEPDLGTTCCFMLILLGLLWMVGMPMRYFAGVLGVVGAAITLLAVAAPYRLDRLKSFTDPFKHAKTTGYHTVEGLYALASGGVFGVGLGQGTSKYGWVPNANSDYVFAIIGEELGLVGCAAVLALFGLLAFVGMRIAQRSVDPFVRLAAGTTTIWLCGQAVINIGYVSGLLPVTGIPLPMISAGGTSLLATFFVLGMMTSFARHEPLAVNVARRSYRLDRRSRLERLARIPVPRPYVAPKRRTSTRPADATSRTASATARPASSRPATASASRTRVASAPPARPQRPVAARPARRRSA